MAREQDTQASARVICQQQRIQVIELASGAVRFIGQGLDFTVRGWADLALNDLKTRKFHY